MDLSQNCDFKIIGRLFRCMLAGLSPRLSCFLKDVSDDYFLGSDRSYVTEVEGNKCGLFLFATWALTDGLSIQTGLSSNFVPRSYINIECLVFYTKNMDVVLSHGFH